MKLRAKQTRFCEEYCVDFNATQAAIRAGYSKKTAYSIGSENLKKPAVKAKISELLDEMSLSAKETTKLISDIARSSLNEYFTVKEVIRRPEVVKSLRQVIQELREEIEDADTFIQRAGIQDPQALETHIAAQEQRRLQIIRYQIELERNPKATRVVPGAAQVAQVAELDLPRLVRDKNAGRIKSVKPTEYGVNVELYAADAALRDLARVHGLFKDNVDVTTGGEPLDLTNVPIETLLDLARHIDDNKTQG